MVVSGKAFTRIPCRMEVTCFGEVTGRNPAKGFGEVEFRLQL